MQVNLATNSGAATLSDAFTIHKPRHFSNLHIMPVVNPENLIDVTYKEVMQLWNLNTSAAKCRLKAVRKSLGKKRRHKLTVIQFCTEEDISTEEFYKKLNLKQIKSPG